MRFSTGTKLKSNMRKLWCTGFEDFKQLVEANGWTESVPDDIAIISINNGSDTCPANECHLCTGDNVLNLDFDDADPEALNLPSDVVKVSYQTPTGETISIQFFTDEQAQTAVDFIEKHKDRNFYVHCSAGVSRSQAFIRYINTVYDELWYRNPKNPCVHPNGFVLQKLMQCWRKKNNYENIFT
jgi:protein tyrosine phosphatase